MKLRNKRKRHAMHSVENSPVFVPYVPRKECVTYGENHLGHVVLVGDSILDNEHYTKGHPDVTQRLASMLPDHAVSIVARDGAVTSTMEYQLRHIPQGATHLVVSIGGNDAMQEAGMLTDPALMTMHDAMQELDLMREMFAISYSEVMAEVLALDLPVTVCTIYRCDFADSAVQTGIAMFNDVILGFALAHGLDILDLRTVCTVPSDYEMVIEPSATGGAKIAKAISEVIS